MIDRKSLNEERFVLDERMQQFGEKFEVGFKKIHEMQVVTIPPTFVSAEELSTADIVYKHYEALGLGDTPEDAFNDFHKKIEAWPPTGELLVWRVRPECDYSLDFSRGKVVWKIYARAVIK